MSPPPAGAAAKTEEAVYALQLVCAAKSKGRCLCSLQRWRQPRLFPGGSYAGAANLPRPWPARALSKAS